MSLNDLNISKKLAGGFAVVVTIVAVMCVSLFMSLQNIHGAVSDNDESIAQLKAADITLTSLVERCPPSAPMRQIQGSC